MFTFLHDIAKPLAENSKMQQQPAAAWPTKIILRLQAANLSTTCGKPVICNFCSHSAKPAWQALQRRCSSSSRRRRSRNGIFCECTVFNSPRTVREHMYGSFRRATCESLFPIWGQRKVLSGKIYLRGLRPCFFHGSGSERLSFFELRPGQQPF